MLERTLAVFLDRDDLAEIVVVAPEEKWIDGGDERLVFCEGGKERADSVEAGLACLSPDVEWVGVHDGARPLVTGETIEAVFSVAENHGAAALAKRVTETLHRSDEDDRAIGLVDREGLWSMETPQVVRRDLLEKAFEEVRKSGAKVTDEVSAVGLIGVAAKLVENRSVNLKITTPGDLDLAEMFLSKRGKS